MTAAADSDGLTLTIPLTSPKGADGHVILSRREEVDADSFDRGLGLILGQMEVTLGQMSSAAGYATCGEEGGCWLGWEQVRSKYKSVPRVRPINSSSF